MEKNNNDQVLPGNWLETHSTEVQDTAISISERVDEIVEALRDGNSVDQKNVKDVKNEIEELKVSISLLEEELNKLPDAN